MDNLSHSSTKSGLRPGHPCGVPPPLRGGSPSPFSIVSGLSARRALTKARHSRAIARSVLEASSNAGARVVPKKASLQKGGAQATSAKSSDIETRKAGSLNAKKRAPGKSHRSKALTRRVKRYRSDFQRSAGPVARPTARKRRYGPPIRFVGLCPRRPNCRRSARNLYFL